MQGETWGWGSPAILGLLAAAAILLPVFLWWETRARHPLVELSLYRLRNFGGDSIILAGVQFALVGASVFGAVWSQQVLGFRPIQAGVALLPLTIPLLIAAPLDRPPLRPHRPAADPRRRLAADRRRPRVARLAPAAAGLRVADPRLRGHGRRHRHDDLSRHHRRARRRRPEERSQASGIVQTMRQVGGVIGIAVLGAIIAGVSSVEPGREPRGADRRRHDAASPRPTGPARA